MPVAFRVSRPSAICSFQDRFPISSISCPRLLCERDSLKRSKWRWGPRVPELNKGFIGFVPAVSIQNLRLQIEAVRWRASLAGCSVNVHQHLDGSFSLTHGPHRLGRYSALGAALAESKTAARRAVEKPRGGKVQNPTFPPRLEIPQKARDSHFPTG